MYTTSEKSARYTKMQPSPKELELYNKWYEIFKKLIDEGALRCCHGVDLVVIGLLCPGVSLVIIDVLNELGAEICKTD